AKTSAIRTNWSRQFAFDLTANASPIHQAKECDVAVKHDFVHCKIDARLRQNAGKTCGGTGNRTARDAGGSIEFRTPGFQPGLVSRDRFGLNPRRDAFGEV